MQREWFVNKTNCNGPAGSDKSRGRTLKYDNRGINRKGKEFKLNVTELAVHVHVTCIHLVKNNTVSNLVDKIFANGVCWEI